jgi:hypothetical protein
MMRHKVQNKFWRLVRTHRGATVAVVVVVLAGVYTFWSVNAWENYTTTAERWQASLRESIDTALALPVSNAEERAKKVDNLRQVANSIESRSKICHVPTLIRWQEMLQSVKEKQQVCNQFTQKAATFSADLQKLTEYLENDRQLTGVLITAAAKKSLAEDDLEAQAQTWKRTVQDIQSMQAGEAFNPVREAAKQSATTIYEAWQKLYDAHKAEDATEYEAVRGRIADAYDTIAGIAAESSRQFKTLASSLQTTYDSTF